MPRNPLAIEEGEESHLTSWESESFHPVRAESKESETFF